MPIPKLIVTLLGLVIAAGALTYPLAISHGGDAAPPAGNVQDLGFLTGTWSGPMWGGEFSAHYSSGESGMLLSYSELTRDGKAAFYEFERFDMQGERLTFTPYPGGKRSVPFALVALDKPARKAAFENPQKDFPTRIVFHRVTDDRLVIELSDPHNTPDKKEVFDLKRAGRK